MKPTEDQLKIAEAMAQKKKLQWFNPEKKEWEDEDANGNIPMHTINELLLFMNYGIRFRIKPLDNSQK